MRHDFKLEGWISGEVAQVPVQNHYCQSFSLKESLFGACLFGTYFGSCTSVSAFDYCYKDHS